MYLTKLTLPANRLTAEALADCQKMHRLITNLFSSSRKEQNILYRVNVRNGNTQVYMYSEEPVKTLPEYIHLEGQRDLSEWLDHMSDGTCFGFDLLASPCKKVHQPERGKNSQRRILRDPQERLDWLQRKADQNGFRILKVTELEQSHQYGRHGQEKGSALHLDAYHYQGNLQITDLQNFRKGLCEGIGAGKAYGLGMLLVK